MVGKHVTRWFYSMFSVPISRDALGRALQEHVPAIWRFALSLSRRPDIADDLTQSTCVRALERHAQFDGHGRLDAWCMTICRSIWLNQVRAETIRQAKSIDAVPESDLVALHPGSESNIFATQVFAEVMKLPEAQRQTVLLVYVEGFRYSEAAAILDVPIGTIMSRLSAARGRLKHLNEDARVGQTKGRKV